MRCTCIFMYVGMTQNKAPCVFLIVLLFMEKLEFHWRFTVTNLALPFSLNFIPMNFDHPTLQNKNVRFAYGTPPIFFCHHHNLTTCNIVVLQLTIKPWPTPPSTIYLIDNVSYDFRSRIPLDPHWKQLPPPSSVPM